MIRLPVAASLLLAFRLLGAQPAEPAFQLFGPEAPLKVRLSFDYKQVVKEKDDPYYLPALMKVYVGTDSVLQPVQVKARGEFRRNYCVFPPLMLKFDSTKAVNPALAQFDKLKLVTHCRNQAAYQQYVFLEYLAYKTYELLDPHAYRARLLEITYEDSDGAVKPVSQYGFLIEETESVAARNASHEIKPEKISYRQLDPYTMTLMSIFQYMIGNTDWYLGNFHNVRVIQSNAFDLSQGIYPVPYDFDYSGLVNTHYAVPHPDLNIENVRQRLYRGPCPPETHLKSVRELLLSRKAEILKLYEDFSLLGPVQRKEAVKYLEEFFIELSDASAFRQRVSAACP
jgi:hypothetical protein